MCEAPEGPFRQKVPVTFSLLIPPRLAITHYAALYHRRRRIKNPEATTPSAVSASAKEAQTVVDPEVVTAQSPKAPRDTPFL